jgi:hypothetical protein
MTGMFAPRLVLSQHAIDDSAKGRIWHGLFMVVLHRPFRAQKAHVLFASEGISPVNTIFSSASLSGTDIALPNPKKWGKLIPSRG